MNIKKILFNLSLLMLCSITGLMIMSQPASATIKTGGGTGGRGSGSLGYWTTLKSSKTESAYQKFLAIPHGRDEVSGEPGLIRYDHYFGVRGAGMGARGLTLCKESNWISYYAVNKSGRGWATLAGSSNKGYRVARIPSSGRRWLAKHDFKRGTYILVCQAQTLPFRPRNRPKHPKPSKCADKPGKPCVPCDTDCKPGRYEETYVSDQRKDYRYSVTVSGVHDATTIVSPEKTDDYADYTDAEKANWANTHEVQTSDPAVNDWGKWADSLTTDSIDKYSMDIQDQLSALKAKSKSLKQGDYIIHPKVTLSAKNREGFAKGGVFDVSENRKYISITYHGSQSQVRNKYINCYTTTNKYGKITSSYCLTSYGPWYVDSASLNKSNTETLSPYSYWQMINTRCNKKKFDKMAKKIDGFVKDDNGNGDGSSTGHTPVYRYADLAFEDRYLGNDTRGGILGDTATDDFFEASDTCQVPINCTSVKQPDASNASVDNVQNNGKTTKNSKGAATYGAQTNNTSTDTFAFFRDGKTHEFRTDLWYPTIADTNSSITVDGKSKALYTRLFFDPEGTPAGSLFGMKTSANGSDIPASDNVADGDGYTVADELTHFWPHATWPSSSKNPERMDIDWTWKPVVTNTVYSKVAGAGHGYDSDKSTNKTDILASCPIKMDSTGTEHPTVINNGDVDPLTLPDMDNFDDTGHHHVSIGFVRSTSDLH